MWARPIEMMFGVWLGISPFVFRYPDSRTDLWANDFICAFLIICLALFSFWHKTRRAHLGLIAVALWMIGFGWINGTAPAEPWYHNQIVTGLLLLMMAIIPSEASLPPEKWRERLESMKEEV